MRLRKPVCTAAAGELAADVFPDVSGTICAEAVPIDGMATTMLTRSARVRMSMIFIPSFVMAF